MLFRLTAPIAAAAVVVGLSGCGGGSDDLSDIIPRATPELMSPADTVLGRPGYATVVAAAPTTPAASTPAVPPATPAPSPPAAAPTATTAQAALPAAPAAPRTPAPAATPAPAQVPAVTGPAAKPPKPPTPKTAPSLTPQPVQTDAGSSSPGAFSEFCRENPGACPG